MKIIVWIVVCLMAFIFVYKLFGKSGLQSALIFALLLLMKDVVAHYLGPVGEYIYTGIIVLLALAIYAARKRLDDGNS